MKWLSLDRCAEKVVVGRKVFTLGEMRDVEVARWEKERNFFIQFVTKIEVG